MARDHLLAIDQGTTSTRVVVYDARLHPVGQGQVEVPPTYPQPGWVEHDPAALVASVGPMVAVWRCEMPEFRWIRLRPSV